MVQRFASNFCDIPIGMLYQRLQRCEVCSLASCIRYDERASQMLCQEAVLWKRLKHPNILSLLGVTIHPPRLISDWISGEDLPSYIETNPGADRVGLVRVPPCVTVTPRQLQPPAVRCCEGSRLSPFSQRGSWRPQGGT